MLSFRFLFSYLILLSYLFVDVTKLAREARIDLDDLEVTSGGGVEVLDVEGRVREAQPLDGLH